jgi:adenylosuccinate synthase
MQHTCLCTDINTKYNENDSIIIENGQGLLLNGNSNDVHTTPSNTTSENLNAIMNLFNRNVNSTNTNIELCYVTRTYLTRHGRGDLSGEVQDKSNISEYIETDSTNVFNPYQENIRYAPLNTKQLLKNISNDYKRFKNIPVTKTIFLTHINEIGYNYMNILDEFKTVDEIDNIYISADKYSENILKI